MGTRLMVLVIVGAVSTYVPKVRYPTQIVPMTRGHMRPTLVSPLELQPPTSLPAYLPASYPLPICLPTSLKVPKPGLLQHPQAVFTTKPSERAAQDLASPEMLVPSGGRRRRHPSSRARSPE